MGVLVGGAATQSGWLLGPAVDRTESQGRWLWNPGIPRACASSVGGVETQDIPGLVPAY